MDRKEAVAEIVPPPKAEGSPWERLARQGRVALGSQRWEGMEVSKLRRAVPIQEILREVREE